MRVIHRAYGTLKNTHYVKILQLKGCKNLKEEVDEMIELLHLQDKTNRQAQTLSGGMKRKLCVGIALIGGSKVRQSNLLLHEE